MSPAYYPVFLDMRGKRAVVIGGGPIAERRIRGLIKAEAIVTLIAPEATPALQASAAAGAIRWLRREFQSGDLDGACLAIAATDSKQTNAAIAREAEACRILLNVVDDPALCTFIAPAIVERRGITIAISTNGRSPALARKIREEIERLLPIEYGSLLNIASDVREQLRQEGTPVPADVWNRALTHHVLQLVKEGRDDEARETLLRTLRAGNPVP